MSQNPVAIAEELIQDIQNHLESVDISPEKVNSGVVSYLGDGIAKVV